MLELRPNLWNVIRVQLFVAFLHVITGVWSFAQTTRSFTPTDTVFPNPERGLYGFSILTDPPGNFYQELFAEGTTLAYGAISLDCCRETTITPSLLDRIGEHFNRMRLAGVKAIPRILYDGAGGVDTTLAWMETHLQQLAPVFEEHKDVIAIFQAGMIGSWGEWHNSSNGLDNPAGRAAVWNLLNTYLPACAPIQVRTPAFAYELEGNALPLSMAEAFSCSPPARLGHHNDCWLASATDFGTYASAADREAWLTVFEYDNQFVPWGGETCAVSALSNCGTALNEAPRLHATYLNRGYHPDVIAALGPCWDTIRRKLGYRLELVKAQLPGPLYSGNPFSFQIELKNTGWAPMYRERPVYLRLFQATNPITVLADYPLNADPRFWSPEAGLITLMGSLIAPAGTQTNVSLALWLPDAEADLAERPEYSIRFANQGVWRPQAGQNVLFEGLSIGPPPQATATVSGGGPICEGGGIALQVHLTGTPPWTLNWSDGLVQSNLMTTPVSREVSPGATTTYSLTAVADLNGPGMAMGNALVEVFPLDLVVSPGPTAVQGLSTIELEAQVGCDFTAVEVAWVNLTAGSSFGAGVNPVALVPHPVETTEYQVTVTGGGSGATTARVLLLVAQHPIYLDLNGDGCNNVADLLALAVDWLQPVLEDPNGDAFIDIRDFLFINTGDPLPCTAPKAGWPK